MNTVSKDLYQRLSYFMGLSSNKHVLKLSSAWHSNHSPSLLANELKAKGPPILD